MENSQRSGNNFDPRLLELLVCPACHGALRIEPSSAAILCLGCRRSYPLVDGIPVLIAERATLPKASG